MKEGGLMLAVLLAMGLVAHAEGDAAALLEELAGKPRQALAMKADELNQITGLEEKGIDSHPLFGCKPWHVWKLPRYPRTPYLVFFGHPAWSIPGMSVGWVVLMDTAGKPVKTWGMQLGYRIKIIRAELAWDESLACYRIAITSRAMSNGRNIAQQEFAFLGDDLMLVRLATPQGRLVRNIYDAENHTIGPEISTDPEYWKGQLQSDQMARQLAALTYLEGGHVELAQSATYNAQTRDSATMIQRLRNDPAVKRRVGELQKSPHPWVREAAGLAENPQEQDPWDCIHTVSAEEEETLAVLEPLAGKTRKDFTAEDVEALKRVVWYVPENDDQLDLVETVPLAVWREPGDGKERSLRLLMGYSARVTPGESRAEIYMYGPDGSLINAPEFSLGWRLMVREGNLSHYAEAPGETVTLRVEPQYGGPEVAEQILALCDEEAFPIRQLDAQGKLVRVDYRSGQWKGITMRQADPSFWLGQLMADDPTRQLTALTFIGGQHIQVTLPNGPVPDTSEPLPAAIVPKLRADPAVRRRIQELTRSSNPWVREAAALAASTPGA